MSAPVEPIDEALFSRLPKLEIVSSFGVGYDHVDAIAAGKRGIVVTHTPDVLTEEVADTTIGLLLCTVRELPQAERYLRAGKWPEGNYPLSRATLRNRSVGLVGMGRIGVAIARRLEAFGVPVAYHTRHKRPELAYRHYAEAHRHGARRGHAHCHRARRRRDQKHGRCARCWKHSDPRAF